MKPTDSNGDPVVCLHIQDLPAWSTYRCSSPRVPVIVQHRGLVVSASPVARRKGVRDGMPADRARSLLPLSRVLLRDPALEAAAWDQALDEVLTLTPFVESLTPGWAFARDVDLSALRSLSTSMGLHVGVATDRETARLAALRAARGHVLPVRPKERRSFLHSSSVGLLPRLGFSQEVLERLTLFGLPTLDAVSRLTKRHLTAQFGEVGASIYALLHPAPAPPVGLYTPPPTLRSHVDLDDDLCEPGDLLPVVDFTAREVAEALPPLRCRRVTVRLHARNQPRPLVASRILPESCADAGRLERLARALALSLLDAPLQVHAVSVELAALTPGASLQGSLFRSRPSPFSVARGVHRRFPGALLRATVVKDAHFHEDQVRMEPFPEEEAPPSSFRRRRAS